MHREVWKECGCKTLWDYHLLYLQADITLLADVFETFRNNAIESYKLDPAHFTSLPELSWNSLFHRRWEKDPDWTIELLDDIDKFNFFDSAKRGGISTCITHYAKANNPYMGPKVVGEDGVISGYDPDEETSYIGYVDANNLYGYAMNFPLPVGDFKWTEPTFTVNASLNKP